MREKSRINRLLHQSWRTTYFNVAIFAGMMFVTFELHRRALIGNPSSPSTPLFEPPGDIELGLNGSVSFSPVYPITRHPAGLPRTLLYVTTHMLTHHEAPLRICWPGFMRRSRLLNSSDVVVHFVRNRLEEIAANETDAAILERVANAARERREHGFESIRLLRRTFRHQRLTIHARPNVGYQEGAASAVVGAGGVVGRVRLGRAGEPRRDNKGRAAAVAGHDGGRHHGDLHQLLRGHDEQASPRPHRLLRREGFGGGGESGPDENGQDRRGSVDERREGPDHQQGKGHLVEGVAAEEGDVPRGAVEADGGRGRGAPPPGRTCALGERHVHRPVRPKLGVERPVSFGAPLRRSFPPHQASRGAMGMRTITNQCREQKTNIHNNHGVAKGEQFSLFWRDRPSHEKSRSTLPR